MTAYDRLRVLWPDHLGLARGKYVPWRLAANGTAFCAGTYLLTYDREMHDVEIGMDPTGFPDVDAVYSLDNVRPGWEEGTGVVVADLMHGDELYSVSARTALAKAVDDWAQLGYAIKVGIELEAYVMEPDGDGGWKPLETPSGSVYGTGPLVDPTGLVEEIMAVAELCEIPLESVNTEFDPPQWELTLHYADAMKACDDVFLFRQMAREVAYQHGLLLTFMGKPIGNKAGSGLHVNFSLERLDDGSNACEDASADDGLSELTKQCIAGLLEHHPALTALVAPTVNAYKRLQPASLSGYWANWGYDHRCASVRIPPQRGRATRIEQRTPDGSAGSHLATAAVLQAARLGVVNALDCPVAETGDGITSINTTRCSPQNLDAALTALEANEALVEAVGTDLVRNFVGVKRMEWKQYSTAVTDWEISTYLPFH